MTVYHGLNKVLYFNEFTAYFNQPVSTTPIMSVAKQFADGRGIILTLQSGAGRGGDIERTPKYLSVASLSSFRNEEEKLFYGEHVE
eukprot:CAMPEP_0197065234 /NCGR_PEP_ID=MMETSP1384-20130603/165329_1 /TAXON_ID=29189 /ORGANISM="Ammonia sp." /LENGTH=85 /DNA_ID=CAMNT_0042501993 /DNA_START=9 /DNA_END=263 /DNA_ORIENTATION=+